MNRGLLIATILTVAAGCDKARELAGAAGGGATTPPAELTNLDARPDVLFQVFGERDDPRMIPIAVISGGALRPIVLDEAGWRRFDASYQRGGTSYPVYRDGREAGRLVVRQGMWERPGEPVYSLPNCSLLTPLAAVSLDAGPVGYTVQFLASTARITTLGTTHALLEDEVARLGRDLGRRVASEAGVDPAALDSLDFAAVAVATGVGESPTLVATFVDPDAAYADEGASAVQVLAIADAAPGGAWTPTYAHVASGPARDNTTQRFLDHLDVTGDGVSEILLEVSGGDAGSHLVVLGRQGERWGEVFRSGTSWCLDAGR